MANIQGFDANAVEPNKSFGLIPNGEYQAMIVASEMLATKKGDGKYLKLEFDICDKEYENRKLWANLNVENPNETAVAIARGDLSAICRAVGVMTPADSEELHNRLLVIKVKSKHSDYSGEQENYIAGYADASAPVAAAPQATEYPANKAPWQR